MHVTSHIFIFLTYKSAPFVLCNCYLTDIDSGSPYMLFVKVAGDIVNLTFLP